MRHLTLSAFLALAAVAACKTQNPPPQNPVQEAATPEAEAQGLEQSIRAALDESVDPCVDFYRYACGTWLDTTELPPDKASMGRGFTVIADQNEVLLREVLESAAAEPGDSPAMQRVGAVYAACMDTEAIDAAGVEPLAPLLGTIATVEDGESLMKALSKLQWEGVDAPWGVWVEGDFKNPDLNILQVDGAGLGLFERGYYFDEDKREVLDAYRAHVAAMFRLVGDSEEQAAANADTVLKIETALAEVTLPIADRRDPNRVYHKLDLDGLQALTPSLPWKTFLSEQGYGDITQINVAQPDFFVGLEKLWGEVGPEEWRTYLRWWVAHENATALSADVVAENFDFFGRTLSGQREDRARWKKCVGLVDAFLGDDLGQIYVDKRFAGDSKEIGLEMIERVEGSIAAGFADLVWMDDPTRVAAKEKMDAITNKIGYPDKWQDYSDVKVARASHFDNVVSLRGHLAKFWMDQVEKPVDKSLWYMSAPTVNAYYNPPNNEIVFPAGIMQPPFFDRTFPKAMNYGAMGLVMGHEVTHGFDDEGRKFDGEGRLREWWAPEVSERFEERAQCVRDLYSTYEPLPGVFVDGKLTAGENIADLGGLKHSWGGYQSWVADHEPEELAGFSGDELFFVAYAQSWCTHRTDEYVKLLVSVDPHSPPEFRVNGAVSQFPQFGEVFSCEVGQPMRPAEVCEVW